MYKMRHAKIVSVDKTSATPLNRRDHEARDRDRAAFVVVYRALVVLWSVVCSGRFAPTIPRLRPGSYHFRWKGKDYYWFTFRISYLEGRDPRRETLLWAN
jgi:hypothetical protein